jgi:hypothetical protein
MRIEYRKKIKPLNTIQIKSNRDNKTFVLEARIKKQMDTKYKDVLAKIKLPPANLPFIKQREIFAAKFLKACGENGIKMDKLGAYGIASRVILK